MRLYKIILPLIVALSLGFSSCKEKTNEPTTKTPLIQVGTKQNETNITLHVRGEQRLQLSGGNGKFTAQIENQALASVKVEDNILVLTGIALGETKLIVRSGDRSQIYKISVVPPTLAFSNGEIKISPKDVNTSVKLSGGDNQAKIEVDDPFGAIIYQVQADGVLQITGVREGTAKLTAKLIGQPDQVLTVHVSIQDKPTAIGVYKTNDATARLYFQSLMSFRAKATGAVTISEKARPYGTHKRVVVPAFARPKVGDTLELTITSVGFDDVEVLKSGTKALFIVEHIDDKTTSLLGKDLRLVVPTPLQ